MNTFNLIESILKVKNDELSNMQKIISMCNQTQPINMDREIYTYMTGLVNGIKDSICTLECMCYRKKEMKDYDKLLHSIKSDVETSNAILEHMNKRKIEYEEKGNHIMIYYIYGQIEAKEQEVQTLEMILTIHKESKNE